MLICAECGTKLAKGASWCLECGPDEIASRALQDMRRSEQIRAEESAFNNTLIAKAREKGGAVTSVAPDGAEVTALPNGTVFFNAADWW